MSGAAATATPAATATAPAWWPRSLFGRIALILFVGLAAAHLLSFWFVVMERGMALRGVMVSYLARDVASSVAMLERLPAAERADWLPRLARHNYRFRLARPDSPEGSDAALAAPVARAVAAALEPARPVHIHTAPQASGALRLSLQLADGAPLSIDIEPPQGGVSAWLIAVLALQLALLATMSWLAVRLATRPLQQLADAADAMTPAQPIAALPLTGPREVVRAAAAFNTMQERIRAHLDERMRILAAVSHDLQTPITRLRLRADLLDDETLRTKLQADLAQMQALVEEGLAYARSAQAVQEPTQRIDLQAFLDSLVADYADAGQPVRWQGEALGTWTTRPQALRRTLTNLVDNALKFAGAAEVVATREGDDAVVIRVLDRGPGIPEDQLDAVLQPFYRVEGSRSRETGGTGLGLAIAKQLSEALHAELALVPRAGGGLEAKLVLAETS